jgi:hypothetical protein
MPRATPDEGREGLEQMTVAFLTEIMKSADSASKSAVEEHALTIDGLAGDLLEAHAEGGLIFLGELATRAIKGLGEQTHSDPNVVLQRLAQSTLESLF